MSTELERSGAIPVTIISGFLGAGKTTLLNHIVHGEHGLRVAVLVNDFGAINIDTQLISSVDGDTINLANGCICCTIRGDLLNAALRLTERPERPEYIIVETSGVSDPVQVAQTFLLPALRQWLAVDSILTVVDAEQLGTLTGAHAYLAMEQMSVADIIILNKVDLVPADSIAALRREWLYPQARVIETTHARVPLELILGIGSFDPARLIGKPAVDIHVHGEDTDHPHTDHSAVFSTWNWTSDAPVSLNAIRKVSRELPTSIYRAKGFLYLADAPDRKAVLHVVGTRVKITLEDEWGAQPRRNQIVLIGAHGSIDADRLRQRFDGALEKNISPLGKVMGSVFEWMRGGSS